MAIGMAQVRKAALALPGSCEAPHHQFGSFRLGGPKGRIYATVPPGDAWLHLFVDEPTRELAVAAEPAAFEPLRWGGKVVGLRVVLAQARPAAVKSLLRKAWLHKGGVD